MFLSITTVSVKDPPCSQISENLPDRSCRTSWMPEEGIRVIRKPSSLSPPWSAWSVGLAMLLCAVGCSIAHSGDILGAYSIFDWMIPESRRRVITYRRWNQFDGAAVRMQRSNKLLGRVVLE